MLSCWWPVMSLKIHKKAVSARLPDGFVSFSVLNPVIWPSDIAISAGLFLIWMFNIVCF